MVPPRVLSLTEPTDQSPFASRPAQPAFALDIAGTSALLVGIPA